MEVNFNGKNDKVLDRQAKMTKFWMEVNFNGKNDEVLDGSKF